MNHNETSSTNLLIIGYCLQCTVSTLLPPKKTIDYVLKNTFYHSAASVFLNVLLLTVVFLRYRYITIVT